MNKLSIFLSFALGATVGGLVSWKIARDRYERIAEQEIAEVKQRYLEEYGEPEETEATDEEDPITLKEQKQADVRAYAAELTKNGYINYSDSDTVAETPAKPEKEINNPDTFMVDPTDYDDDYDIVTLNYYADGVVTDSADEIVEDADNLLGLDLAEYFGRGDEDSAYVRNGSTKIEYEVLYNSRNYYDIKKNSSGPR